MIKRDYHKDLKIDPDNLETEWIEQASLYMYYSEAHAEAILEKDTLKQEIDIIYAELDAHYRAIWSDADGRMTETGLKSKVLQDSAYISRQKALNKAILDVNILLSAKTAFDHRKKALENIVSMKIAGFWSEPKLKKNIKEEIKTQHKKQLNKSERMRKRRTLKKDSNHEPRD